MVGGALLGAAANRQVCPTISEMTFGNHSNLGDVCRMEFGDTADWKSALRCLRRGLVAGAKLRQ